MSIILYNYGCECGRKIPVDGFSIIILLLHDHDFVTHF